MTQRRHLIAAALLCAVPFGPSGASTLGTRSQMPDPPIPDRKGATNLRAVEELQTRDLKRLQGKWKVVREQSLGQEQKGGGIYAFKDNALTYTLKDHTRGGTFTIDTSRRPRWLVWKSQNKKEENKEVTIGLIYTFDDDHLLLSYSTHEWKYHEQPPTDFGSGSVRFLRLERVKD